MCAECHKIRDEKNNWHYINTYIVEHTEAKISHGVCPDCTEKLYGDKDWYQKMKTKKNL